jgi:transposase
MRNSPAVQVAVLGIDIGKNTFHAVGLDQRGAIVLRQKRTCSQLTSRLANLPTCLIGMEACVGAHYLARQCGSLGHEARLMPAKYVKPYVKGQKNDFRDAEAIAEAVQRPTMVAAVSAGEVFTKGRDFAAWLGLVPKQISTGDRTVLGPISRRGNRYLRALFVQAAWVVLVKPQSWARHGFVAWIEATKKRLHRNVLAVALANKLARIAWAVLVRGRRFEAGSMRDVSSQPV